MTVRQGARGDGGPGLTGVLRAGAAYFGLVFAAGFVLGILRVLAVAPAIGARAAELLELPLMLLVAFVAAGWVVRRFRIPPGGRARLAVGLVALALLLVGEVLVALLVRGVPLSEYVASRDPVSGGAYLASLAAFALMPWLAGRR